MAGFDHIIIETGTVSFTDSSSESIVFTEEHNSAPAIVASYEGSTSVNVFVTSVTKTGATIETSSIINGVVQFQAISSLP
tara:strand:+ start:7184 stop:7423 length:240 start_codon:yes stop_codon:yes gene_type:complete